MGSRQVVALSINKVQAFLFETINSHVQEKQKEKATLKSIQQASNEISKDFFSVIEETFENSIITTLLSCSGVYIFYCEMEESDIKERLNNLFLNYYKDSQGKKQLRYVCFSEKDYTEIEAIKEAKKRLKMNENWIDIIEKNKAELFSFKSILEQEPRQEPPKQEEYPMFAKELDDLLPKYETKNVKEEDKPEKFRIAVIKADLDGMGDMFQQIDKYETYCKVSKILNEHIGLDGLHNVVKNYSCGQKGWIFPFYVAGDDIFFAVSISNLINGINVCREMIKNINNKLGDNNIKEKLSMSIGVEIVFNKEPIRYYLNMVEKQLKNAKAEAKKIGILKEFVHATISIGDVAWVDVDIEELKIHKKSLGSKKCRLRCNCQGCQEKRDINMEMGRIPVWKYFQDELEILASIKAKDKQKELIGTSHFFYSLLEKLTNKGIRDNDTQYMNHLLYHLIPKYIDNKYVREAELRINRGIIFQLYQKTNRGNIICLSDKAKKRLEAYLRLMLLFSDKRFEILGIEKNIEHRKFGADKDTIRKELISKPREYLYDSLEEFDSKLLKCFACLKKGKGEYLQLVKIEKSMFFKLRNADIDISKVADMIELQNPSDEKDIEEKNKIMIEQGKKPYYKCFHKQNFINQSKNWNEDFIDSLMLLYEYHNVLREFKRIYKKKEVGK